MTATALALHTGLDPALDFFDDVDAIAPRRPELRLIPGGAPSYQDRGYHHVVPAVDPEISAEVYRRRRFLALIAATTLVLAIAWAAGLSVVSFGAAQGLAEQAPEIHVVLPGDSYAAIAADLGVANPVAVGEQLRAANGGSELVVGQRLVLDVASLQAAG